MLRSASFALGVLAVWLGSACAVFAADSKQPAKVYRVGFLSASATPSDRTARNCPAPGKGSHFWRALLEGFRERGYVLDRNLLVECRYTEGREENAPALAAELVNSKVDLLVVFSSQNVRAAKQATRTIPIVMMGVIDPAGRGIVESLARPGGNVTGPAGDAGVGIVGRRLQLLKEAVPQASRVAVLGYETQSPETIFMPSLEEAATALHVALRFFRVHDPDELERAFATMSSERAEALLVLPGPFMWANRRRIVELAARNRLPGMYPERDHVVAGGLMSYDIDQLAAWRRVGYYADRIFKGANPGDLPVEQPTKFELLVNLGAAKALGVTIPQSLILRADEVIE